MEKICLFCGSICKKLVNESSKHWENKRRFCSKQCFDRFRQGKPSPSKGTTFKKGNKIYSVIDTRTKKKGSLNNKWKGGITPIHEKIRKDRKYLKWRKQVLFRDDNTCQACGIKGVKLNVHHELSFSDYPDLRIEVLNGITLCVNCHRKVHSKRNY